MISVQEATRHILDNLYKPGVIEVPVQEACGRVLSENIVADRDLPPFDRVAMDGIAVSAEAIRKGIRRFRIAGVQSAGVPPISVDDPEACIEIMTGAALPSGLNIVIRYEDVSIADGFADVPELAYSSYQNVHRKGSDSTAGDVLLTPGILMSPAEVAVLASVGKSVVRVKSLPVVAIVSTGDELVDIMEVPEPFQIRRSNSYMLLTGLRQMGIEASVHHIPDQEKELEAKLGSILDGADALIISGGISKGKFDFVPKVLDRLGVQKKFQHVSQRPGKPFWFGTTAEGKVVFALPGNPVSTFLCFSRYVKPWIYESLGIHLPLPVARLTQDITFEPPLTYFVQVRTEWREDGLWATPVPGGGSGDFANLRLVDGFLELPAERSTFRLGEAFPLMGFRTARG